MKYFTMDELNDIANELLKNPSRETLRFLNDKYNKSVEIDNIDSNNSINIIPANIENAQTTVPETLEDVIPKVETPIWQPAEQIISQPSIYSSSANTDIKQSQEMINNNQIDILQPASQGNALNIPTLNIQHDNGISANYSNASNQNDQNVNQGANSEKNQVNISNNFSTINPVSIGANLWENQDNKLNNMMQTTDNFNNNLEAEPNNNNTNNFFSPLPEQPYNSVPIYETTTQEGPTMFGQFEQNFNNDKAA